MHFLEPDMTQATLVTKEIRPTLTIQDPTAAFVQSISDEYTKLPLSREFFIDTRFKAVLNIVQQSFVILVNYRQHVLLVSFIPLPEKTDGVFQKMNNGVIALIPR